MEHRINPSRIGPTIRRLLRRGARSRISKAIAKVRPEDVAVMLPMVVVDESDRPVALFRSDFDIDYAVDRYKDLELYDAPPAEEDKA